MTFRKVILHISAGIENGFLAIDGIEYGSGNRIPLWLFGLLY